MTHFTVAVVVPAHGDPQPHAAQLLAAYDEDLNVPERDEACYCVGVDGVKGQGSKAIDFGPAGTPRVGCSECDGAGSCTTTYNPDSKWDWYVVGGRWDGQLHPESPRYTGPEWDAMNGGKPDGYDVAVAEWRAEHERWATGKSELQRNCFAVSKIPEDFDPWALVTPDGVWHEKGKMGWWAMSDKTDASEGAFQAVMRRLLVEQRKQRVLILDAHI